MKVLICDKTENEFIEQMRDAGLTVDVRADITPEELPGVLPAYDGMVVRSRTKVRQALIDVCPNLKVIVRGGVGLDSQVRADSENTVTLVSNKKPPGTGIRAGLNSAL